MKNIFISLSIILFSVVTQARHWEKISIPGARCGNGEDYSVFFSSESTASLVVEFMGGGACWSEASCHGKTPMTSLKPIPQAPGSSVFVENIATNPWNRSSVLYVPYCTGDVFSSDHVAEYKEGGKKVYHQGARNTRLMFEHLAKLGKLKWNSYRDVTVAGSSAGAIGALVHAATVEKYAREDAWKTLISDSPGLHFGSTFWRKFPTVMRNDFARSFASIGLQVDFSDGFLVPRMGPVFENYSQWHIGILQSTRDLTMSVAFGNILPEAHRRAVLGPQGIQTMALRYSNVSTWINDSTKHVFLHTVNDSLLKDMYGQTAKDFTYQVYESAF